MRAMEEERQGRSKASIVQRPDSRVRAMKWSPRGTHTDRDWSLALHSDALDADLGETAVVGVRDRVSGGRLVHARGDHDTAGRG